MPSRDSRAYRRRTLLAAALAVLVAPAAACGGDPAADDRPNLVLIVVDTLRADALLDPASPADTPHLDRLAADGVVFERAFAHAPITLPSHTSLFSSRHPFETGVYNNGMAIADDVPLLADWLREAGYEAGAVVSMGTLKGPPSQRQLEDGFDDWDGDFERMRQAPEVSERLGAALDELEDRGPFHLFAHYCDPHEPYNAHGDPRRAARVLLDGEPLATVSTSDMTMWRHEVELPPGSSTLEVVADEPFRIRWLDVEGGDATLTWDEGERLASTRRVRATVRLEADGPARRELVMWINDAVQRREGVERYFREVEFVDAHVGAFLDELRARGLYDDSLIVFTSDHGEGLGEHGHMGHIHNLYDEQIHVPLVVKLPAGDPRRERLEARRTELARHVDVVPTILELLGVRALPGQRGRSLLDEEGGPRLLVAETHTPEARRNLFALRDDRYKLVFAPDEGAFEMYDLRADPHEHDDRFEELVAQRPEWPDRLREIASIAKRGERVLDEESRRRLEALGY